mgnify:CR=1 FL=1
MRATRTRTDFGGLFNGGHGLFEMRFGSCGTRGLRSARLALQLLESTVQFRNARERDTKQNKIRVHQLYKTHHERFIDLFFENYNVEKHIVNEVKNNFLTFKKKFSNVDLELLVCAVIFFTLEYNGCIVSLNFILQFAPRLSTKFPPDTSLINRILKFKRKMEETRNTNTEDCKELYFLNFTEKLIKAKIIPRQTSPKFLENFKDMHSFISKNININSKRPLQTEAVLSIFYVLETKLKLDMPKEILKNLCQIAGLRDNSINYWMQIVKKSGFFNTNLLNKNEN